MPGLVPGIQVTWTRGFALGQRSWMAGTSPAMTNCGGAEEALAQPGSLNRTAMGSSLTMMVVLSPGWCWIGVRCASLLGSVTEKCREQQAGGGGRGAGAG